MTSSIPLRIGALLVLILVSTSAAKTVREQLGDPEFKLYSVIFGVTVDAESRLKEFKVAGVGDPQSGTDDRVNVEVPKAYIEAARKEAESRHYEPHLKDGEPVEFYIYYFFSPALPSAVITDLDQPLPTAASAPPHVAANAPKDQPQRIAEEKWAAYDAAIAPYVEKARASYDEAKKRFLAGLPPKHSFFITTRLRDKDGKWEQVFIAVQRIDDGKVTGRIWSDLRTVKEFKYGETYVFPEAETLDWLITKPDGSEEGNFVGKFLDTYRP